MNTEGLIISLTPYKESGAIINILTKDGPLSFYVRSLNNQQKGNLLLNVPLMYADFTFKEGKKFLTFVEMKPLIDTRAFMKSLSILSSLNFIDEIILKILEEDERNEMYDILVEIIKNINETNYLSLATLALASALRYSGNGLNVDSCVRSNTKTDIIAVSFRDGGLVSRSFYKANKDKIYSKEKIQILRELFKMKNSYVKEIKYPIEIIYEILNDLLIYAFDQTGVRFKSEKLLLLK